MAGPVQEVELAPPLPALNPHLITNLLSRNSHSVSSSRSPPSFLLSLCIIPKFLFLGVDQLSQLMGLLTTCNICGSDVFVHGVKTYLCPLPAQGAF